MQLTWFPFIICPTASIQYLTVGNSAVTHGNFQGWIIYYFVLILVSELAVVISLSLVFIRAFRFYLSGAFHAVYLQQSTTEINSGVRAARYNTSFPIKEMCAG